MHNTDRVRNGLNTRFDRAIILNNVDPSHVPRTTMGKGDKRTRKGKIWKGSYGKVRPRKPKKKK